MKFQWAKQVVSKGETESFNRENRLFHQGEQTVSHRETARNLPACFYCVSISFPFSVIRSMLSHWAEGSPSSVHTVQPSASSIKTS